MTKSLKSQIIKNRQQDRNNNNDIEIDINTANFNIRIFNKISDYEIQKEYFEKFFVQIIDSDTMYRIAYKSYNGYWERELNAIQLSAYKRLLKTTSVSAKGQKIEESFIDKYLQDIDRQICYNIVFRPDGKGGDNLNLFTGFNYKDILYNRETDDSEIITEEDEADFKELLQFFKDYLCGGEEKTFDYLFQHLAQIVQKPCEKNDKIFVFFSEGQGRGKSAFLKFVAKAIGQQYAYFDKLQKIIGNHTTAHVGKLINVIEEMDFFESTKYKETLKDFCQRDSAIYNAKNVNEVIVETFVRYFITTNNTNGINIDDNDRRYVVLQILECLDKQLVMKVDRLLKSKKMIYLFGKYLENIELKYKSEIQWREARPITKAYRQMVTKSSTEEFINELYTCGDYFIDRPIEYYVDKDGFKVKSSSLYLYYKEFCKTNTYREKGKNNFTKELLNKFDCIKKVSRVGGQKKTQNVIIFKTENIDVNKYKNECQITEED